MNNSDKLHRHQAVYAAYKGMRSEGRLKALFASFVALFVGYSVKPQASLVEPYTSKNTTAINTNTSMRDRAISQNNPTDSEKKNEMFKQTSSNKNYKPAIPPKPVIKDKPQTSSPAESDPEKQEMLKKTSSDKNHKPAIPPKPVIKEKPQTSSPAKSDPVVCKRNIWQKHFCMVKKIENFLINAKIENNNKNNTNDPNLPLSHEKFNQLKTLYLEWNSILGDHQDVDVPDTVKWKITDFYQALNYGKGNLYDYTKIFPIYESGSFQVIDNKKKPISTYKGRVSKQLSSIINTLEK